MLSMTCVSLSEVVLNGASVGTDKAVHFPQGTHKLVQQSYQGSSNMGAWGTPGTESRCPLDPPAFA